jgi:tight adherence protein B
MATVRTARSRLLDHVVPKDLPRVLRDMRVSELAILERLLSGREITTKLESLLRLSGVAGRPGTFLTAVAVCALVGFFLGTMVSLGAAALLFIVGAIAPWIWLSNRRTKRREKFEEQLPDAIDMLVKAMRAGYSLHMAMKFIGEEVADPLGGEFARFSDEQRLGIDVRTALLSLQSRVDSTDLKMFVTALLVQRDTGGNLSEILGNIADVIRQRADVNRQIDTMTAESRMSARLLAALPALVFIAMMFIDPRFFGPMVAQPIGRFMLAYAIVSIVVGYVILMRLSRVDF